MHRTNRLLGLIALAATLPLTAGCHRTAAAAEDADAPGTEPISLAADTVPLPRRAMQLRSEVDTALAEGSSLDAQLVYRIAALSGRTAVARLPFAWSMDRYDLAARVKEVQALADRITAEVRRGIDPDSIRPDLLGLRAEINNLQTELAEGGGPAPPSLDSLMRGYPREHTVKIPKGGAPVE